MIKKLKPKFEYLGIKYIGQSIDELNDEIAEYSEHRFYLHLHDLLRFDSLETYHQDILLDDWLVFCDDGEIIGLFLDFTVNENYEIGDIEYE